MSNSVAVQELNRRLAQKINQEARRDPASPFAGKFVGIAQGQIVTVASDLDELVQRLSQLGVHAEHALCLEAGLDYDQVQEIWGTI